jgi:site-specific DNA recombinase
MNKLSKPTRLADPAHKQAVIYARVSSKEQEKEGFSIPAQLKLLKEYAAAQGFKVAQEYVDVETAKATGRTAFGQMVEYLKAHPTIRALLVEKTDRLYRNLKDWVTVDELDVEMHFPKEGVVLSRESRSSEKFMHGIKVLMAKNYIDNLSEEARKGMQEKAEQGIWPTKTPLGYRNITGPDGKKIIAHRSGRRAGHRQAVRVVCHRPIHGARGDRESAGPWPGLPQERSEGSHQHGKCDPAQPALLRSIRVERQAISRQP